MKNTEHQQWDWFGASVRGPLHQQKKRPNEDAWKGFSNSSGTAIVVSDGMGSKPNARNGAQMACYAVRDALHPWVRADNASPIVLLRLIHLHWGLRISPISEADSAATCLFAVVTPSGKTLIAQLGDGIAVLSEEDGKITLLTPERAGFSNQTTGLGVARSTKEWSVITRPSLPQGAAIFLATDGIADDLASDSLGDLIKFLLQEFSLMNPQKRWHALCRELRNWPTPHHLDDKTLAVLWHNPQKILEEKQ